MNLQQHARFFTLIGHPREVVVANLREEFPQHSHAEINTAYEEAVTFKADQEAKLAAAVAAQERAAVEAEHNLGTTMHRPFGA